MIYSCHILEVVNCATFNDNASILHQTVSTFLVLRVFDAITIGLDARFGEEVALVYIVRQESFRHGRSWVESIASFMVVSRVYSWELFAAKLVEDVRLPLKEVSVIDLGGYHQVLLVLPKLLLFQLD